VTVLEQCSAPGGRAAQLRDSGFTWDTGPSLITMPWVLEDAFAAGGLDLHAEVTLRRLDPLYRIRWAGEERTLDFSSDVDRLREEVARFDARDALALDGFLAALKPIYEEGLLAAGRRAFTSPAAFASLVPAMVRLGAILPLHAFVSRHFRNPRVREAFSFHSLFIGGDPYRVPAIYGSLVYLQLLDGGWYTDGGVYSLVEAMARPLDVRCDARVESIETGADGVRAVRLASGERIAADVVISNADVLRTHELLGRRAPRRRLRPTMSAFLLYLGCDRRFDELLHHTLLVGHGYRQFIRDVTRGRGLPSTFSTYVHAPARTEAAMATPGGDSLAVLMPVPNLRAGVDWERTADGLRDALVRDMETTFGLERLDASVQVEHRMAPPDFASRFGAVDGNAFAVEPTLHQSAYFRAPNRVAGVRGLYHVGGGTHPGAGIPGVLMGAAVTAGLVNEDTGVRA
jgi:phytoene desaturase